MGKKCDLCDGVARMYCESDQASLCWNCDGKVHGANFLVAKHTRCLLCSACQSLTPWKASGLRLGPTFSVCDSCVALKNAGGGGASTNRMLSENPGQEINGFDQEEDQLREDDGAESYDDDEDEDEDEEYSNEDEDDEDEDEDEVDDEEAENQVVPWSAAAQLPPMMSESSSNGGGGDLVAKRTRDFSDEDEIGCSSAQESNYSRPLKRPSRDVPAFKSTAVINSIVGLAEERTLNGVVDSPPSSSSRFFAIAKTRIDLNR
uniref:B-box zinc finger protein 32 n=3 Tax=Noccaea caerulescens TaxID=107243 RepID=A0A1J3FUX0_NOCCA